MSDDLPTADEMNAAAGDEEDRAIEIQDIIHLKEQAKETLVDVLSKGLGAAIGGLPIPSELISEAAGAIVDQVLDTIMEEG